MPTGIPNVANNCYVSVILQCIRRTTGKNIRIPVSALDGNYQDPNEFYMQLMEILPESFTRQFSITVNGDKHWFLMFDDQGNCLQEGHKHGSEIVVAYFFPSKRSITSFRSLLTEEDIYIPVAFVCALPNHYYAIIEENGTWWKCDDEKVSELETREHNIYMVFFMKSHQDNTP